MRSRVSTILWIAMRTYLVNVEVLKTDQHDFRSFIYKFGV